MKGTGIEAQGGHAEYMLMNADATYLIPDTVSYEQAAPIFCAGYTVYSGLRWADPQPHERVAVLGIGGLGHLAVQYAKAAGFETIAISHSPDKDKLIRELGADEIVRDGKNLAAAGGADIILSTSNSTKSMVDSIQGLRPDGRLIAMGADAEPLSVSLMDLIMKRIRIIGSQRNGPEYLYEALDFVAQGKVKTIVETYPLAEAAKAYERVPRRPHNVIVGPACRGGQCLRHHRPRGLRHPLLTLYSAPQVRQLSLAGWKMWTAVRDPLFDESEVLERGAGQRLRFFHARGFLAGAANADSQEHLSFKYVERAVNFPVRQICLLQPTATKALGPM